MMKLRVIETLSLERLERDVPELYATMVLPDDDGGNVTSALGELRVWLIPPVYSDDGTTRTLELVVRVGNPLVRNSGKFKGALDYVDEVVASLDGFSYASEKSWRVVSTAFWKSVGTVHWYEVRFRSVESSE